MFFFFFFFFSSRRRHTRWPRDWSSDVCSSDLFGVRQLLERAVRIDADVVHEHVDPALGGEDGRDRRPDPVLVREVDRMRKNGQTLGAERVGCGPEPLSLAVEKSDAGPLGGEAGGGVIAETLCGARHESRLAG